MLVDKLTWERPRARQYVAYPDPGVRHHLARYQIRRSGAVWRLHRPFIDRRRFTVHPTLAAAKQAAYAHHDQRRRAAL